MGYYAVIKVTEYPNRKGWLCGPHRSSLFDFWLSAQDTFANIKSQLIQIDGTLTSDNGDYVNFCGVLGSLSRKIGRITVGYEPADASSRLIRPCLDHGRTFPLDRSRAGDTLVEGCLTKAESRRARWMSSGKEREKDGMTRIWITREQGSLGKIIFNGKKNVYFFGNE